MSADTEIPLKSVAQLAKHLGVGEATVYKGCHETDPAKRWPYTVIAGKWKFTASQVAHILALQAADDATATQDTVAEAVPIDRLARAARRLTAA